MAESITRQLTLGKRVLWLVPGGSAIAIAVAVSKILKDIDLTNLTVTLTDERFGPTDHQNSNWYQFQQAGFAPRANLIPVLGEKDIDYTTRNFAQNLARELAMADYKLGFFGMGADGHTAGILPGSMAVKSSELAANYTAGDFQRITITPATIKMLDEAVLYAVGSSKQKALVDLGKDLPLNEQPAQILKSVNEFIVYNDYKGEEI